MSQGVAKINETASTALAAQQKMTKEELMALAGVSAADAPSSRIILMQGSSVLVKAKGSKLKAGDLVLSEGTDDLTKVGDFSTPLEIIPITNYPTLLVEGLDEEGEKKFIRNEPKTAANESLPFEDLENGAPITRTTCFNILCLLVTDVAQDKKRPVTIRIKCSNQPAREAGKKIASTLYKRAAMLEMPYSQVLNLGSDEAKGKSGDSYAHFKVTESRLANAKELEFGAECLQGVAAFRQTVTRWKGDADPQASLPLKGATPIVMPDSPDAAERF